VVTDTVVAFRSLYNTNFLARLCTVHCPRLPPFRARHISLPHISSLTVCRPMSLSVLNVIHCEDPHSQSNKCDVYHVLDASPRRLLLNLRSYSSPSSTLVSRPGYPLATRLGCPENAFCTDTGIYLVFHDELSVKGYVLPIPALTSKLLHQLHILLQTLFPSLLPARQNGNISLVSKCAFKCLSLSSLCSNSPRQ
jgi:hypothetical protein